ncbi:MAG: hypothetical protein C4292_02420 [Nitrososphaera sp.]
MKRIIVAISKEVEEGVVGMGLDTVAAGWKGRWEERVARAAAEGPLGLIRLVRATLEGWADMHRESWTESGLEAHFYYVCNYSALAYALRKAEDLMRKGGTDGTNAP